MSWTVSELLFYGGLAAMAVAALLGLVAALALHAAGRRLRETLRREYGEKRR